MKRILIILLLLPTAIFSQEKGKLKLSVDFGAVFPKGKTDFSASAELKYNLTERMNIGFRIEGAGIGQEIELPDGSKVDTDARLSTGYIATFDYLLKNTKEFSPFVGGGIGYYKPSDISTELISIDEPISLDSEFGLMLRTGAEFDKVRLSVNYHLIPSSEIAFDALSQKVSNSYLGISIGYNVGGGKYPIIDKVY